MAVKRNTGVNLPSYAPRHVKQLPDDVLAIARDVAECAQWGGHLSCSHVARGKCEDASMLLAQRLIRAGHQATLWMMVWPVLWQGSTVMGRVMGGQGRALGHVIVDWGGQVLDLTANQFTDLPRRFPVPYAPEGIVELWMDWIDKWYVRNAHPNTNVPHLEPVKVWGTGFLT